MLSTPQSRTVSLFPIASNNETKKEITAFLFVPLLAEYLYENTNDESLNCINSKNTSKKKMVSDEKTSSK